MTRLKPVRQKSIREVVIDTIRGAILNGKFQPGDTLSELHLARDLNVSQVTVREALQQLEHIGLVVRTPNKHTTVTKLTREEFADRIAVRLPLEITAAVAASSRLSEKDFATLEELGEAISAGFEDKAYFKAAQADFEFHRLIWRASGNTILSRMLEQLTTPLFTFVGILESTGQIRGQDLKHSLILEALKRRDATEIVRELRDHMVIYEDVLASEWRDLESLVMTFGRRRA